MDPYRAWLAQMPRESVRKRIAEIEKQIEELPKELAFLRKLDEMSVPDSGRAIARAVEKARASDAQPADPVAEAEAEGAERPRRRRKLSPVRRDLLEAVGRLGPGGASPVEVSRATGKELALVQKTMSRMARAGQLVRVGHSQYDVPRLDADATLLGESSSNGTEEAIEP